MKLHTRECAVGLKLLFTVILLIFLAVPTYGQSRKITGMVKSEADGEPLIGVSVSVKGAPAGTITDSQGVFSVDVREGQTLVFSYIGFRTQEVKVGKQPRNNVSMQEDTEILDEVVVVGYGTMKRSDLTGALVSISEKEIKKSVITTLDQALQGRAAGVQVTQNSGAPGAGISVSIRGINSLNGNEPLYVIDGIPVEGQTNDDSNALAAINPSDIVSMEVLKDASATAIYGSRASNGVVLITTRRGEAGRTKVSYEGYYALQNLPKKLDVMNLREYAEYSNLRASIYGFDFREEFKDPSILGEGTDWQDEIYRTAQLHNHQLSISGGGQSARFAASLGYQDQEGICIGSDFNRLSARINLDTNVGKFLDVGLSTSIARMKRENTIDDSNVITTAIRQMPDTPARNPDGSFGAQMENIYGVYFSNPLADAMMNENYDKQTQIQLNGFATLHVIKGLDLRVEYGGSYNYFNHYEYRPIYDNGNFIQDSSGSRAAENSSYMSFKTYATYNNNFHGHGISIMLGHEAQESNWERLYGYRSGFMFNTVHELGAGDALTAKNSSNKNDSAIESYYGRFNYNYNDRYLLTTTIRADGSSTFGPNNRWGWFPSLALAWRINKEKFMKDVPWLQNLKLRLGWGIVGNQWAGNYAYGSKMYTAATVWGTGFYPGNYSNENLKWEQTASYNLGLDISLFNNRIEFIFDTYYKNTDNLLMQATLPQYVNGVIESPFVNAGRLENKGFEFTLNTVNIANPAFRWTSSLIFSLNRNKIKELYTETAGLPGVINGQQYTYTQAGQPAGQFYGYKVKGMFCKEDDFYLKDKNGDYLYDASGNRRFVAIPTGKNIRYEEVWYGDFMFEDINNDGVIDEQDRTYIGNPEPKFTLGFTNNFSYKNFDLSIFLNAVVGNDVYNYIREQYTKPATNMNLLKEGTNIARVEYIDPDGGRTLSNMYVSNAGTAQVQRIYTADANNNNRVSSRFVEDGSYLRIKNISLGYTFPERWLKRLHIDNLRIYCNLQNMFTFTKYKGYDPEAGAYNQSVVKRGIDYARYPSQRIYTIGLNISL